MPDKNEKPKRSIASRLMTPLTDLPSRIAGSVSNAIDAPRAGSNAFDPNSMMGRYEQFGNRLNAGARGMMAGMTQGVGDLTSDMTSPASIFSSLLGVGGARQAARGIGQAVSPIARAIRPTMDIIEDIPTRQINPSAMDVDALLGDLQARLARIPSRGQAPPQMRPPMGASAEMVQPGAEAAFNAGRPTSSVMGGMAPRMDLVSKAARKPALGY